MSNDVKRTPSRVTDSATPALRRTIPPVLHGTDPELGFPVTWHLSAVTTSDVDGAAVRIDRIAGSMDNPDLWMQAHKESRVVSEAEAIEFVHAVQSRPSPMR
ncbi:hypothetical protein [Cellulomonas sp. P24]|uniref:hypothetical protein n=1 Tax=Cellulomonas sp. P24 TaxID=2885206 RepID=UPI00216AC15C|nr:hypothetical protein [Cellulomonas sp. P24]MCR6492909.1 hypothetical protein [Cellulomonas sp. P24]